MAIAKIRVTVPLPVKETFHRLSDHKNLKTIIDLVTTSELTKYSNSDYRNGLGAIRQVTFNGNLLTEEVVAWHPPIDESKSEADATAGGAFAKVGYDYKVVVGSALIADHLGEIRLTPAGENASHLAWNIHLKVPFWAMGEVAAYFVCRSMEKKLTESIKRNLK